MNAPDAVRHYFTAQVFLTRLPAPCWVGYDPAWMPLSCAWFPLVGALVGGLSGATFWLVASYSTAAVGAVCAVIVAVLLTGALHEDALADTADGIGGGRDQAQTLAIMRDSTIGSYGAVALILAMALRIALLTALGIEHAIGALVLAHSLARASVLPLMAKLRYLRESGVGSPFVAAFPTGTLAVCAALVLIIVGFLDGVIALIVAATVAACSLLYFQRRLGGITGDGFGAVIIVVELAVLLSEAIRA
ncbi:MAG: adenosylcobinamide-GDP ribazoletransferase [Pseudomonadota bacterium]